MDLKQNQHKSYIKHIISSFLDVVGSDDPQQNELEAFMNKLINHSNDNIDINTTNLTDNICDDLLSSIIAYSSLCDLLLNHRFICKRWYNLIDIIKSDENKKYKLIKLWSNSIQYAFKNNFIINMVPNTNIISNHRFIWAEEWDEIDFWYKDGYKMYCQFIYGLEYIENKIKTDDTMKVSIYNPPQNEYYKSRHEWNKSPTKYGLTRYKIYCIRPKSHLCTLYMEPMGFDPIEIDNTYIIQQKQATINGIKFVLNVQSKNINYIDIALTKMYEGRAIYAFIWMISFIVDNHEFYGYNNSMKLIKDKLKLCEWQYACISLGNGSNIRNDGGHALWKKHQIWFLQILYALDTALKKLMKSSGDTYDIPSRDDQYLKKIRLPNNSP